MGLLWATMGLVRFAIHENQGLLMVFNKILKEDRALYGHEDDYVIGDIVPDEWQQRVDDVVGGSNAA
jgi:hypothetical protein